MVPFVDPDGSSVAGKKCSKTAPGMFFTCSFVTFFAKKREEKSKSRIVKKNIKLTSARVDSKFRPGSVSRGTTL